MIFEIFITVFILGFIYLFDLIVVSPYLETKSLKRKYGQSVQTYYGPIIALWYEFIKQLKIGAYPFQYYNDISIQKPNVKCVISSGIKNNVNIAIIDHEMSRQFLNNDYLYIRQNQTMFLSNYKPEEKAMASAEGQHWKTQRQILSQFFHFKKIQSFVPEVQKIVDKQMKLIKNGQHLQICRFCESISGKTVINTFFGSQLQEKWSGEIEIELEQKDIISYLFQKPMMNIGYKLRQLFFGEFFYENSLFLSQEEKLYKERFDRLQRHCEQYIDQNIEKQITQKNQKMDIQDMKFVDLLVQAYLEGKLNYKQIFGNFLSFFFAGMDTTGTFAGYCVYMAGKYPEIQQKLREEVDKFYEKNDGIINEKCDFNQLTYMGNFIKECFRFFTPGPGTLMRIAKKDHYLGDILVKKGWTIFSLLSLDVRNPNIIPNCDVFDPDRWDTPFMKQLPTYSFLPFSAGPRNCIGQQLAQMEIKLMLANLVRNYYIEDIKGKQIKYIIKLILTLKDDELIKLSERNFNK